MNILFLTHRLPYPPDRGDRIRSYHIIRYLAHRHRIVLAAVEKNRPTKTHLNALKKLCVSVNYACIDQHWQKIKILFYLPTLTPLTLPFFYSKELQQKVYHLDAINPHSQRPGHLWITAGSISPVSMPRTIQQEREQSQEDQQPYRGNPELTNKFAIQNMYKP